MSSRHSAKLINNNVRLNDEMTAIKNKDFVRGVFRAHLVLQAVSITGTALGTIRLRSLVLRCINKICFPFYVDWFLFLCVHFGFGGSCLFKQRLVVVLDALVCIVLVSVHECNQETAISLITHTGY